MVSVNNDVDLLILSGALLLLLVGIAVRIAWARFGPDFRNRYGPERGPMFLVLFLLAFPAFVVADLATRRRGSDEATHDR